MEAEGENKNRFVEFLLENENEHELSWLEQNVWDENQQVIKVYPNHAANILVYNSALELLVDNDGRIEKLVHDLNEKKQNKLAVFRYATLLIDFSAAVFLNFPTPRDIVSEYKHSLIVFINNYFNYCPLAKLSILVLTDDNVICICTDACNSDIPITSISRFFDTNSPHGSISIVAGLRKAFEILNLVSLAAYIKEIIYINASIYTNDKSSIFNLIEKLKTNSIIVSVVSVAPTIHIIESISKSCNGFYAVADSYNSFNHYLFELSYLFQKSMHNNCIVKMGFPTYEKFNFAHLCSCHSRLIFEGYKCPQCLQIICNLPYQCSCGIQLCSSVDVARAKDQTIYKCNFQSLKPTNNPTMCIICERVFLSGGSKCNICDSLFCLDCEIFIYQNSLVCPNCLRAVILNST